MMRCKCGHDPDLHSLVTFSFVDSPEPHCERIQWRFKCRGTTNTGFMFMPTVACACYNLDPVEAKT